MKKLHRNQSGQVTIEFIFAFSLSVMFLVFFLYFAFNFTVGYIVHYATYSASRAYLSHDIVSRTPGVSLREAKAHAQKEFDSYSLKSFGIKSKNGYLLQFNDPDSDTIYEYVGALFSFKPPFSRQDANEQDLEYLSESFLGREPSRAECGCQILEHIDGFSCQGGDFDMKNQAGELTVYDNGC